MNLSNRISSTNNSNSPNLSFNQNSSSSDKKQEKLLLEKIRAFQKSDPENRRCVDCGDVGPVYVCMDYGSFVCTTCSGLQ